MHTSRFNIEGYGDVAVIHNGDWSGEAHIVVHDDALAEWVDTPPVRVEIVEANPRFGEAAHYRVTLPAGLLIAIGREVALRYLSDALIGTLENLGGPGWVESMRQTVERHRKAKTPGADPKGTADSFEPFVEAGIPHFSEVKNNGHHVILYVAGHRFDYWPSRGRWCQDLDHNNQTTGIDMLVKVAAILAGVELEGRLAPGAPRE